MSVAIGELADGLRIELDKVPKKYAGLDGTEIAISESQERMAVVVAPQDVEQFLQFTAAGRDALVYLGFVGQLFQRLGEHAVLGQ